MFRVNPTSDGAVDTGIVESIGVVPKGVVAIVLNSNLQLPKHQKDRFLHHIVSNDGTTLKTANDGSFEYTYNVAQLRPLSSVYYKVKSEKKTIKVYAVPNGTVKNYSRQAAPGQVMNDEVDLRRRLFINLADVQMCNTDKCYNAYKCACVNLLSFVSDEEKNNIIKKHFSYVPILFAYNLIQPFKCSKYVVDLATLKNVYEFCVSGKYTNPNTNSIYKKYADELADYDETKSLDALDQATFANKFVKYLLYVNNRNLESVAYIISITDNDALINKYYKIYSKDPSAGDIDPRDSAKVEDFKYSACTHEPFKLDPEYGADEDSILDEKFLLLAGLVNKDVVVGGSNAYSSTLAKILSQ